MTFIVDGTNGLTFPNSTTQASAGQVLQVVSATYSTSFNTTSTSFTATGLSASITPKFSNSKILIIVHSAFYSSGTAISAVYTVFRGTTAGTNLGDATWGFTTSYSSAGGVTTTASPNYLDSPGTTSATTYTVAIRSETGPAVYAQPNGNKSVMTLLEIAG
jgi:hypothetical protein